MIMVAGKTPGWTTTWVFVDGERIERCYEADDDQGVAFVHATTQQQLETGKEHFVVRGKVEFRPIGDP